MFWKKKRSEKPVADDGPIIAALLMEGDVYDTSALSETLATSRVLNRSFNGVTIRKGILAANLGDEIVAIAPMPAPYPWSDLEGPCHTSWLWPKGTSAMDVKRHQTHVLVTMTGGRSSPIERRLMATQITAIAARQPGVLGIYWPDATLVHNPTVFQEMGGKTMSPEAPPLYLWVDFHVFRNDDGSSGLFTTGLAPIGLMELEIPRIDMPPGELREWAVNISYYLLDRGGPIPDGDTIGVSETHQMRVRHGASNFGLEGTVMRVLDGR